MYHALEFFRDNLVTIVTAFGLLGWILAVIVTIKKYYLKEEIEVLERPGQVRIEPKWNLFYTQCLLNHMSQVFVNMEGMTPVVRETVRFVLKRLELQDDTEYDIFKKKTQLNVKIGEVVALRRKLETMHPDSKELGMTEEQEEQFLLELEDLYGRQLDLEYGVKRLDDVQRIWKD